MTERFPALRTVVLDATDARAVAEFWRQLLGFVYRPGDEPPPAGQPDPQGDDWLVLRDRTGETRLAVQRVDELAPSTWPDHRVPQQLHLDLTVGTIDELVAQHSRATALGATVRADRSADPHEPLFVYADPAGHPFCIFVSPDHPGVTSGARRAEVRARLAQSGFVAAGHEADALLAAAGDDEALAVALERRLRGEPLAWIVGCAPFCGSSIRVSPGVYVPRAHSELLVHRAVARLPADGVAVDVCTGSGAIAAAVQRACPHARVVGCDVDAAAVACARTNGIVAYEGDLLAPLPPDLHGRVDVLVGVVPYVPTAALPLLQRDTFAFEDRVAYDGGADGLDVLRRVAGDAARFVRPGGAVVLELGGEQADLLAPDLHRLGFVDVATLVDDDGQARGIEATWSGGTIAR